MAKVDTRDHIVNIASQLFYERGYNLVGINEIIERSGIAKATLYNHFKSKDELCLAYLDSRDTELMNNLIEFCRQKPKGQKRIIAVLEFLLDFFNQKNFNGCWCLRTIAEVPKESKRIREKIRSSKVRLLEYIESLVKDNLTGLTNSKATKMARSIYLLYESSLSESHLHDEDWPIHHNIDVLKTLLRAK